jgi:hypothetical protein
MKSILLGLLLFPAMIFGQANSSKPASSLQLSPFYLSSRQSDLRKKLSAPAAIAVAQSGNIYVFDDGNSRIVKLDRQGRFINEFGQPGSGAGQVQSGGLGDSIAVDREENVYVVDPVNPKVQIFNSKGQFVRNFRVPFPVSGIAVSSKGEVFLAADTGRPIALIFVFTSAGKYVRSFGERLIGKPGGLARSVNQAIIACDPNDNILVAFRSWPLLRKYSGDGKLVAEAQFKIPSGLLTESQSRNYSLEFFAAHPDSAFALPLLSHSISTSHAGIGYLLLNGHNVVVIGTGGQVLKQLDLRAPTKSDNLFIRIGAGSNSNECYLLDIKSSGIYRASKL